MTKKKMQWIVPGIKNLRPEVAWADRTCLEGTTAGAGCTSGSNAPGGPCSPFGNNMP